MKYIFDGGLNPTKDNAPYWLTVGFLLFISALVMATYFLMWHRIKNHTLPPNQAIFLLLPSFGVLPIHLMKGSTPLGIALLAVGFLLLAWCFFQIPREGLKNRFRYLFMEPWRESADSQK